MAIKETKKRVNLSVVFIKMKIIESVELERAVISLMDNSIIKIHIKEHSVVDVDDIIKFQEAKRTLIGDSIHSVLFITTKLGTLTKEAREFSAAPEVNINAKAKAIVAANLGMRILTNFFISVNKPPILHKAFSNEKDAIIWIKEIK